MSDDGNLVRMKTLDDAWNAQNWDVFRKRHSADTAVFWPGQPEPTRGRDAHQAESEAFFKSIENHLDNNPYKVMFASGDWTCTIARWTGRMIGPVKGLDGKMHPATNKPFDYTVEGNTFVINVPPPPGEKLSVGNAWKYVVTMNR